MIQSMPSTIQESIARENLSIEVTTRCTSNCSYCFVRAGNTQYYELDYKTVFSVISEGYKIGYRHLHITGGEPLLWKHLFDIMNDAVATGYESILLNTNGLLLSNKTAHQLASIKGINLSISLQGFQTIHDTFRGYSSFVETTHGIEMALQYDIPVYLYTVIGRSLLPQLPHFVHWAFEKFTGLKEITLIQLIYVPGAVGNIYNELLSPDDFLSLVNMISLLGLYGFPVTLLENPLATVVAHMLQLPWFSNPPQLIRPGRLTIMADRSINIAHSSRQSLGVYSAGKLHHVLSSEDYWGAVGEDTITCASCDYRALCHKAGMQRPTENFRYMYDDVPYCKRVIVGAHRYTSL